MRNHEQIPDGLATRLGERLPGHLLAGTVDSNDSALTIEYNYQCTHGIENPGNDISFFLKLLLGMLEVGDVEGNPVNEPGAAIRTANHLGFALEPDHAAVSGDDAIGRAQRLARQKHLGGLDAPTLLVIGVNLLVPE